MYDHLATASAYKNLLCRFKLTFVIPRVQDCGFQLMKAMLCAPC